VLPSSALFDGYKENHQEDVSGWKEMGESARGRERGQGKRGVGEGGPGGVENVVVYDTRVIVNEELAGEQHASTELAGEQPVTVLSKCVRVYMRRKTESERARERESARKRRTRVCDVGCRV
jgi:hypothetical protein